MGSRYTVVDEFHVKDNKILVLNKKRAIQDFNTSKIDVDGQSYTYGLTHNETWVMVQTNKNLIGKELVFVH